MIMCAVVFFGMQAIGFSQVHSEAKAVLSVSQYDEVGKLITKKVYQGLEAQKFDVPKFIKDNYQIGRIIINGHLGSELQIDQIQFDSNNLDIENEGLAICEVIETELMPIIGVAIQSTDDLNGVAITRVIKSSEADRIGLLSEEVILAFNEADIVSPCELKQAVRQCEVGQIVPISIRKKGQTINHQITLGAQVYNKISYKFCPETNIRKADIVESSSASMVAFTVYPNPTSQISHINFRSDSSEPIVFYVIDMFGHAIHKEYFDFSERLNLLFDFDGQPSGTYSMVIQQDQNVHRSKVMYLKR